MEVILAKEFEYQYENEMFKSFAEKLGSSGLFDEKTTLLAGNLLINNCELDALLIKKDAICILEFKNAEGPVHFVENGPWTVGRGSIVGGSRDNPFSQVRSYRIGVKRFLERNCDELLRDFKINSEHVSGCVVFRGPIEFHERVLDPRVRDWFHVTDQARLSDKLVSIQSRNITVNPEFISRFVRISGLGGAKQWAQSPALPRPLKVGILKESPIRDSFKRMKLLGHLYADGAEKTIKLVTRMIQQNFIPKDYPQIKDPRIRGSTIYEVTEHCSLLVIQSETMIFPIVVGDPENLQHWIENHVGYTITIEGSLGLLVPTKVDLPIEAVVPSKPVFSLENKPVFGTLGQDAGLNLEEYVPSQQFRELFESINSETSRKTIEDLLIGITNEDHRTYLGDLINLLLSGNVKGARARILLRKGMAVPVETEETTAGEAVQDLENSEDVLFAKGLTEQELKKLLDPDRFEDWMLFLHPDQQKFVEAEYNRPVVLKGVSGSGKTCILVHRARYLAKKYPKERIGILTLNPKLCSLLKDLVSQLCVGEERQRIVVLPFYDVFRKCLEHFGLSRFVESYYKSVLKCDTEPRLLEKEKGPKASRWKSPDGLNQIREAIRGLEDVGETRRHIDQALRRWPEGIVWNLDPTSKSSLMDQWEDFHMSGNLDVKEWMGGVEKRLQNETHDAMRYLREEFSLIQSSFPIPSRFEDYMQKKRSGRCIPFEEKLRHDCLRVLAFWEEWLLAGGFIDESMMALALQFFQSEFQSLPEEFRYRCLLIDEMQDFSTLDLSLIRALSHVDKPDGLFLAGDPVQKILVKNHNLNAANLDRGNVESGEIKKNYRNSRQILEAASILVTANFDRAKKLEEQIELLNPELALRETNRPTAVKVDSREMSQITVAWKLAKLTIGASTNAKHAVCIATASPNDGHASVTEIMKDIPKGMGCHILGKIPGHPQSVAVCELEDLKGFEFRSVIIIGCDQGKFPSDRTPSGETWREALRLYVAMTRARDQLFFLYASQPSDFLLEMWEALDSVDAEKFLQKEANPITNETPPQGFVVVHQEDPERPGFCHASGCGHPAMIGDDFCYSHGA